MKIAHHHIAVAARSGAAIFGGYLTCNLFVLALRGMLRIPPAAEQQLAIMLAFILYALIAIWVFSVPTAARACAGVAGLCAGLGAIVMVFA